MMMEDPQKQQQQQHQHHTPSSRRGNEAPMNVDRPSTGWLHGGTKGSSDEASRNNSNENDPFNANNTGKTGSAVKSKQVNEAMGLSLYLPVRPLRFTNDTPCKCLQLSSFPCSHAGTSTTGKVPLAQPQDIIPLYVSKRAWIHRGCL